MVKLHSAAFTQLNVSVLNYSLGLVHFPHFATRTSRCRQLVPLLTEVFPLLALAYEL